MADHLQNDLDQETITIVAAHVNETLSGAHDDTEYLSILKTYAAAAVFGYAEKTSLATAADWLRQSADYLDGLAKNARKELH